MTSSLQTSRQSAALLASGKPTYLGMWTWLWQRISSLMLVILLPWHWIHPYSRPLRIAVLFFVVSHAMAGIRVVLTDLGLAERWHRGLIWLLAGIGLLVFLYFAIWYA
jgi:succinate dehydrogenase hydrophobic anchor subunit